MSKAQNSQSETAHRAIDNSNFNLWVLFDQTRFAIFRARELELGQNQLTSIQAEVLYALHSKGGEATQKEIAEYTMRQHHSVSTLINRMTARGLIKKVRHPGDKKTKIMITEKGREIYQNTPCNAIEMIFDSLSEKEREQMAASLKVLRKDARGLLGLDYTPPFLKAKTKSHTQI